jgi:SAM-dependent methyltransferase
MPDATPPPLSAAGAALREVRAFWERNPLCAAEIPHPLGSPDYFRHYDRLREENESPEFSRRLHEYPDFAGKRVLDVGCGNGYVLSRYAVAGARVTGVDLTETAVRLSRERFRLADLPGDFLTGNAEALPFPDASFDCVCSMGVLHHTPDTQRAVGEVRRVLRPGGLVILMLYHRDSALYRLNFGLRRLLRGEGLAAQVNAVDGRGNPKGDVYSRAEGLRLLRGFTDREASVGLLLPWMTLPVVGRFLPRALLRPLEGRYGWFLYLKGRKGVG